jgi:hypothetical protein
VGEGRARRAGIASRWRVLSLGRARIRPSGRRDPRRGHAAAWGRFVKPGVPAVYGSGDEETAFRESAARLNRLAGRGGARFTAYPRITYVISVRVATLVDLTLPRMPRALLTPCLDPNDVTASQEVGEFLRSQGVQAITFPSAIPGFAGRNVVVFRDATPPHSTAGYRPRQSRPDPEGA